MIRIETDTIVTGRVKPEADFRDVFEGAEDFDEFTTFCGLEMKSAVLAAIVAAQDEYVRMVKSMAKKPMPEDLAESLKETIFGFVEDLDLSDVAEFRELVTG